jgi:hypothetical protein
VKINGKIPRCDLCQSYIFHDTCHSLRIPCATPQDLLICNVCVAETCGCDPHLKAILQVAVCEAHGISIFEKMTERVRHLLSKEPECLMHRGVYKTPSKE